MGCYAWPCWPRAGSQDEAPKPGMRGIVVGELGRWRTSIELLEKEGRKQRGKDALEHSASKEGVSDAPQKAAQRAGLSQSYKALKERLFRMSGGKVAAEATPANNEDEDGTLPENSAASWKLKRSRLLESLTSGEYMVSTDPAVLRDKLLRPPNEKERQATVDALRVVHGSQDELHFNSIVTLAAKIFKVPFAGIAIVDGPRVWMKAVNSSHPRARELPREHSFVSFMLLSERKEVMVVEDTREDGRFHDLMNMTKSKKKFRFFAGAPLYASNGYQIGALTITDTKPRKLDAGSFSLMTNLAEMVIRALEKEAFGAEAVQNGLPPAAADGQEPGDADSIKAGPSQLDLKLISEAAEAKLQALPSARRSPDEKLRSMNMLETGIMVCNAAGSGGPEVLYVSSIWSQLTGVAPEDACSKSLWQVFSVQSKKADSIQEGLEEALQQQKALVLSAKLQSGGSTRFQLSFKAASADSLDPDMPLVGVPSFVEFSLSRNLRYFFVTVRRASEPDSHRLPTSAFEEASAAEAWVPRDEPSAETIMEDVELTPDSPPRASSSGLSRKPSVYLPYNDDLFSTVTLGPLLGRGSFGRVHRGLWQDEQIAVKILETFHQGQLGQEVDDLPEAALMESMQHPNVMRTYKHATRAMHSSRTPPHRHDFGQAEAQDGFMLETWLLLEYCNKGSLQDAIDRGWFRTEPSRAKGVPDMGIILSTALDLAKGLEYLHGQGVLHGDLSPGNVLLHNDADAAHGFTVKIADFGLSRAVVSTTVKTQTFGTITHMPPELLMDGRLTKAADVYSFGVLLWGMFTGVPPWQGMRRTQVLFKVTALGATLQIPATCPPFLKDLLQRCLQRDHKERPAMAALVRELDVLVAAARRGDDMQRYPSLAAQRRKRSVSMPKPKLPGVSEDGPLGDGDLRKTDPGSGGRNVRKAVSLQRRPSFSRSTQLEVF